MCGSGAGLHADTGSSPAATANWRRTSGQVAGPRCARQASTSKPHAHASSSVVAHAVAALSVKPVATVALFVRYASSMSACTPRRDGLLDVAEPMLRVVQLVVGKGMQLTAFRAVVH